MSWWQRLRPEAPSRPAARSALTLDMPGWREDAPANGMRVWHNEDGDALALAAQEDPLQLPPLDAPAAVQQWCRALAEASGSGLIDVRVDESELGDTLGFIYKRLKLPAYVYTGMLLVPDDEVRGVWTVVCAERGTTGIREAVVASQLMSTGELTIEEYKRAWAQDPYDATYAGVDRSNLRFQSDAERYDEQFPEHPLSKVRRVLAALPTSVWLDAETPNS